MAEPISMCDQKDCKEPAKLSYRWDWGEQGVCCQHHGLLLQQAATNLSRNISLTPITAAVAATPLERSERTQLIARALSAEAEADDIKARGAELYKANVELTRQVQVLTLQVREANASIELKDRKLDELQEQLEEKTADLASVTDELQRLQLLAGFTPGSDTQPGTNVNG